MRSVPEHLKFADSLTVVELVSRFHLQLFRGNSDARLTHVSTPETITLDSFAVVYDNKRLEKLPAETCFVCLTNSTLAETLAKTCPKATILVCDNPRRVFADILFQLVGPGETGMVVHKGSVVPVDTSSSVHRDAVLGPCVVIGPNCTVDAGVVIGAFCVLAGDVHLSENCRISEHCWLAHSVIGANTKLAPGTVIGKRGFGFDGVGEDARFIPHLGRVVMGTGCDVGAGVTIDRGVIEDTYLGDYVMIDNQVHIAHNVSIGDNSVILGQAGIAGSARIGANCAVGAQVGIADHVNICDDVTILSKSGVTKDITMPETYAGFPASPARQFWAQQAAVRRLLKRKKQ